MGFMKKLTYTLPEVAVIVTGCVGAAVSKNLALSLVLCTLIWVGLAALERRARRQRMIRCR